MVQRPGAGHSLPSRLSIIDEGLDTELPARRHSRRRDSTSDTLVRAVYNILKETEPSPGEPGEPMHYRDLVFALESRGIYISGQDPGLNLVAHIHKDPNFFRPERGVYGLKEWYPKSQRNIGERSSRRPRTSRSI